jgi:hypothetical protein
MSDISNVTNSTQESTELTLGSLVSNLNELNTSYDAQTDEERTESIDRARLIAVNEALSDILTSDAAQANLLKETVKAASSGRRTLRLRQWTMSEGLRYNGRFLLDLLNKSELLERMQAWLTDNCTDGIRVFYHPIKRTSNNAQPSFAVTLSWDSSRFDELAEIIEHNRDTSKKRTRENQDRRNGGGGGDRRGDRRATFSRRPERSNGGGSSGGYRGNSGGYRGNGGNGGNGGSRGGEEGDRNTGDRNSYRRNTRGSGQQQGSYRRNNADSGRQQFGRTQDFGRQSRTGDSEN